MTTTLQTTKPHCESMRPYGYRFDGIDLVSPPTFNEALDIFVSLRATHTDVGDIQIGRNNPLKDQIIFSIAAHIEGNFGLPYHALIVFSEEHEGTISIYIKKTVHNDWWTRPIIQMLRNYLMGMRAMVWLINKR